MSKQQMTATPSPSTRADEMTKHTGGPWHALSDYAREDRLTIIGNVDGEYIDAQPHCTFDVIARCMNEFDEFLPNAEANARLIAAAPEMLDALKLITSLLIDCGYRPEGKAIAQCRAAIAKATGAP